MCPPRAVKPASCSCSRNGVSPGGTIVLNTTSAPRRHDVVDDPLVVHVIEREVLLADDLAALGADDLTDLLVQRVRPDVVGRRHVEASCAPVSLHQPREERLDLLRRHRAGAEDQRVALLALVLLRVEVERLRLVDHRSLDGLAGRAVDAADDDVDADLARRASSATASATASSVALSSTNSSTGRPSRPPRALMSSITILATLALAMPMKDRAPVWSVMRPTRAGRLMRCSSSAPHASYEPRSSAACGLAEVAGLLEDRRDLGVGHEVRPARLVPVEQRPDAVLLGGVAEHRRALRAVQRRACRRPSCRTRPGTGRRPRPSSLPGS